MDKSFTEDDEIRLTIAALVASMVRAAEPSVPGLSANFLNELTELQRETRYWDCPRTAEAISWTKDLVKKRFVTA